MNGPIIQQRRGTHGVGGFTLVELLVTITIIGILAAATMSALNAARETAKAAKTKSLIARLDRVIMQRYESYKTRRVPISTRGLTPRLAAVARLEAIRDLMRMEMPERRNDISDAPIAVPDRPALSRRYLSKWNANPGDVPGKYATAECLYLIVSMGPAEERELFHDAESGDKDGDGWPEFHDGWGNPIYFLRAAPAFTDSMIQAMIDPPGDTVAMEQAALEDHDPFDTRRLEPDSYRLMPLIYSCGPDEEGGLDIVRNHHFDLNDIYYTDVGRPLGKDHFDNIHNHRIEAR